MAYSKIIADLSRSKGWSTDWRWLSTGLFVESGEFVNKIICGCSEEEIADEFADVMHYLLQLAKQKCPSVNLDEALSKKIERNVNQVKKTTDAQGNVVRK